MDDIIQLALSLPIERVLARYVRIQHKGGSALTLCPFHADHTVGSLTIGRKYYTCWACGAWGNAINFVSQLFGISRLEAAVKIAEDNGLISHSDAMRMTKEKRPARLQPARVQEPVQTEPLLLAAKAGPEHLDKVYRCFATAAAPLTEPTKKSLLDERCIPPSSLKKYFMYPLASEGDEFWKRFRQELAATFGRELEPMQDKLLIGVPGFFVDKDTACMTFLPAYHPTLGIKIFDRNGRVSGIQLRKLEEADKAKRYRFLSSGFADGEEKSKGIYGCSCGFVEDVLYPLGKRWNKAIALTEGRFKSETLAKLGFLTVNMHGISNWKAAGAVAKELTEKHMPKQFVLCYDAEQTKPVYTSARNLTELLKDIAPVEFAVWDKQYGKGIDDVVNAGNIKEISRISAEAYLTEMAKKIA